MIWLVIISALLILLYTGALCYRNEEIPYSISATFYTLEQKWLFSFCICTSAILMLPAILEITEESYQFLGFLSCIGMVMTGIAPHFKEGIERKIHITGAIMCITLSQIWVMLTCPLVLLVWGIYIVYTSVYMYFKWKDNFIDSFIRTRPLFWVEIAALVSVYFTILISL